jgi:hypothetical protein
MDCDERDSADLAERYLGGRMDDAEATRYEAHFFGCGRCVAELRTVESLGRELEKMRSSVEGGTRSTRRAPWLAAAAAVTVLAVGGFYFMARGPIPSRTSAANEDTTILQELARIEPPPWTPSIMRGNDEASRRFAEAMESWPRGEWGVAIPGLREAARLDPKAPHVAFYLGVGELLTGNEGNAIVRLRHVIGLGETPYLEESRFYLAKAHLAARDIVAAEAELKETVALAGPRAEEARRLLARLESSPKQPQ